VKLKLRVVWEGVCVGGWERNVELIGGGGVLGGYILII